MLPILQRIVASDIYLSATIHATSTPQAGLVADILAYDGTAHGDYIAVTNSPESLHAYAELNAFLLQHLQ